MHSSITHHLPTGERLAGCRRGQPNQGAARQLTCRHLALYNCISGGAVPAATVWWWSSCTDYYIMNQLKFYLLVTPIASVMSSTVVTGGGGVTTAFSEISFKTASVFL